MLGVTLAVLTAVALGTYTATPKYKSVAEIQVSPDDNVLPYTQMFSSDSGSPGYLGTQVVVLKSPALASRVAKRLKLAETDDEALSAGKKLLRNLEISPVLNTEIIRIGYSSTDPAITPQVANTWAEEFVQYTFDSRYKATMQTAEYLKNQLVQLKDKIAESEKAVLNYARSNRQLLLTGTNHNILLDNLAEYYRKLTSVEVELMEMNNEIVDRATIETLPERFKTPTMKTLQTSLSDLTRRRIGLIDTFGPKWPELVQVENEISHLKAQLETELDKAKAEQRFRQEHASSTKLKLIDAVDQETAQVAELHEDLAEYDRLRRESEIDSKLYEGLLQRLREAGVAASMNASNIRTINRGELPSSPYSPDVPLNLALGLVVALASGVLAAFAAEGLDKNISSPEEVEALAGAPMCGAIPEMKKGTPLAILSPDSGDDDVDDGVSVALPSPTISFETLEHYLRLRTSVALGCQGPVPKAILMTSALPQEGKTTTAINLGLACAHTGARTVLVDMDLRRPSLHTRLQLDANEPGIADYLVDDCQLVDCVSRTSHNDLFVIPAGSRRSRRNPARLLVEDDRFAQALETLSRQFDHIIIDSPPLLSVADSTLLSRYADGVLLVVNSGRTPKNAVKQCAVQLARAQADLLGVVVNNVKGSSFRDSYYPHYTEYAVSDEDAA